VHISRISRSIELYRISLDVSVSPRKDTTTGAAGRRSPALIHKWNNLTVRSAGLISLHDMTPNGMLLDVFLFDFIN
jgi:hypothetical protein